MTLKPGEIVAIPFPYTDLRATKQRPVLVLTPEDARGDFISLAITSVPTAELTVKIEQSEMASGQLPKTSWIRCNKVFTLSTATTRKTYGLESCGKVSQCDG
ncbi:MAG: type II toxin-antitoxin system PemK/MazF family toxin [Truepera sp.]|nr:type II toxin-antitoxin system PemK/MazF family toxin [Truepera sp.]MBS3968057.1 type II toxin-antitoxin system PemK/MazF family toxin [Truepera sp.]MBS3968314.1 type II toxin-antitoxin system PemK/MazF family toxin [Truepera sp.]